MEWQYLGEAATMEGMGRLFTGETYGVLIYDHQVFTHLVIRRKDEKPIERWDEIQRIKNSLCGDETWGYEVYPAESCLVNVANSRHLWVFKKPFGFGYRERVTSLDNPKLYQPHVVNHENDSSLLGHNKQ